VVQTFHTPVLCKEAVDYLVGREDGIYVDGTLGGGGHAEAILEKIYPHGKLIGIDADDDACKNARRRLEKYASNVIFVHDNTVNIASILAAHGVSSIHGILLDLGVSSYQLDEGKKGFSFRSDEMLDMRMDRRQHLDAKSVVNTYPEEELALLFRKYGEEKNSRRLARAIANQRALGSIETTGEIASIVEKTIGSRFLVKSLARIFQALRIEVNNELANLSTLLRESLHTMETGGRMVVISYHSLEDRIVKKFFLEESMSYTPSENKLLPDTPRNPNLRILTKKPVRASKEEQQRNPRSRSAKMRAAERI
jgi:16S rRNA (cytosine1402-N4)-methyltransferase